MAKSFDALVKRTTTGRTRRLAAVRTRQIARELLLSEMRTLSGKSQRELARTLGIKQPTLSKLESQSDMQVSTLRRIVKALGGQLEVFARFPNETVRIGPFNATHRGQRQRRTSSSSLHAV